jgi:hypothetical protein
VRPQRIGTTRAAAVGVTAGVAAYAALASGVLGGVTGGLARAGQDLLVHRAVAAPLPAFDDCEQLRRWYVRAAIPQVGAWGFGLPVSTGKAALEAGARTAAAAPQDAVGSSRTGTNVQEQDVDEADVAKTDGRLVVRVVDGRLVVTDVSGTRPRQLSATALPGPRLDRPELVLDGDQVVVVGDEPRTWYPGWPDLGRDDTGADPVPRFVPPVTRAARARITTVDLGDPAAPRVTGEHRVDGGALSTRSYPDGSVRVVVTTGFPSLHFVRPGLDRSAREATRLNRAVVRDAPVDAWLPGVRSGTGTRQQLTRCGDVRHPRRPAGFGTISVLTLDPERPAGLDSTAVAAAGDLVYSSAQRLYVATPRAAGTDVHAFALEGDRTSYVGSGSVPGTVRDRWSMDEHAGHLRVATALGGGWLPRENAVVVLAERHGSLVRIGRVDGLGRGERIMSVRWFDDLAVLVTFRQTDPVHTVDLSDPARPRVLGELHVAGYSGYLHPVGDDLLVGLGHDATADGTDLGVRAATFDLRDRTRVRRVATLDLGRFGGLSAEADPRTVTYLPARRVLLTGVQDWSTYRSRIVAVHVSPDGALTTSGSWSTDGAPDARTLPLDDGRVALVDGAVRVVRVG